MADHPVTLAIFARFYREVMRPDIERVVDEAFAGRERRIQANFDRIFRKLDKMLESASTSSSTRSDDHH